MHKKMNRKSTVTYFFILLLIVSQIRAVVVAQSMDENILSYATRIVGPIPDNITDNYIKMMADRYDYVMTTNLQIISKIRLFNDSIQLFYYFDTPYSGYASYPENYYAHSSESTHPNQRIKNIHFNTYFMDIFSREWKDEIVRCLDLAFQNGFDGVMMDDCGPGVESNIDFFPDDYPGLDGYMTELGNLLEYVKFHFPEKAIIFNGLLFNKDYTNIEFLEFMDGGFREGFVFNIFNDTFLPETFYIAFLDSVIQNTQNKLFLANAKIIFDRPPSPEERLYAFGSYLLIAREKMSYNLESWILVDKSDGSTFVQYYPEMDISLGPPIKTAQKNVSEYQIPESHLYEREFEKGWVIVNPSDSDAYSRSFEDIYLKVIPVGGGLLNETDNGHLEYEEIDRITLDPKQGAIILKNMTTALNTSISNPDQFSLFKNYPNPFNPTTIITYQLAKSQEVNLRIYNLAGQEIDVLVNRYQTAGEYNVTWTADGLPSGIYFYKLQAGNFSEIKKLILQK